MHTQITCRLCNGSGVVSAYGADDFLGAGECPACCCGTVTVYESGATAAWPGGPFLGQATAADMEALRLAREQGIDEDME